MNNTFVYFMLSRINGRPAIKIGYSWKPKLRAVAIRRTTKNNVTVLANIPFNFEFEAQNLERKLHNDFRESRITGEWFEPIAPLLSLIDKSSKYKIDAWPVIHG